MTKDEKKDMSSLVTSAKTILIIATKVFLVVLLLHCHELTAGWIEPPTACKTKIACWHNFILQSH